MTETLYVVYGASGCGRGLLPIVRSHLALQRPRDRVVFVDDALAGQKINGTDVMAYSDLAPMRASRVRFNVAVASPQLRERLSTRCLMDGYEPFSIVADSVVVMDEVSIGPGASLSPFVTLTSNIRVGRFFHANLYSYVEHDCHIGDFVTFGPGVHCNGNVMIDDYAYIGSGALLRNGNPGNPLVIGRGATVGMGAVVTRSVAPGAVVVGNPARPLSRQL
jgi:sugar O-acyltransferase (sialic acid O-acetyltransferase NeuD family)